MWWRNPKTDDRRRTTDEFNLSVLYRPLSIICLASLLAGCFQPLYGQPPAGGGPSLQTVLSAVDVAQIDAPAGSTEARLAVELRNALLFKTTGGAGSAPPTHRLKIQMTTSKSAVIIDVTTRRPEFENYGIDVKYTLTDITTGKPVMQGTAFARASYDIPGQQQRFAGARGRRDAEERAVLLIADQIQARLASFFVAGT
jgi:LPS-assembly lipoprotein